MTATNVLCMTMLGMVLAGCQSMATDDPSSVWFKLPAGAELVLHRELTIPAGRAHVMLQHGSVQPAASSYAVACRFEVRDLGPRTIRPDTFRITGYSNQREWFNHPHTMHYYKTIRLASERQPDILPMVCEYLDYPLHGRPISHLQIEAALGEYFSFRMPDTLGEPGSW